MQLQHIKLDNLKPAPVNVRKIGKKDIADLLPSIRSLGILQPLLVRPTRGVEGERPTGKQASEGYEVVAGQRRYHAAVKLAQEAEDQAKEDTEETGEAINALPFIIMDEGDDAKAIEASLAENIARLPMDEIDQYKAFAALLKQGKSMGDIAATFGVTERLVKQRLAIANLIVPILSAYRKGQINASTVRTLTLATKKQQREWWALFQGDDHAPQGNYLKEWLFGGADIPTQNALFDLADYKGGIVTDLFGEDSYFDDAEKFWELQNTAIAKAKEDFEAKGWAQVHILEIGAWWSDWEHCKTPKTKGSHVYVQISSRGEVTFHEGYLTKAEAKRLDKATSGEAVEDKPERPELTKVMQNYLDLHRHSAVRAELLTRSDITLRLAVAQIIAGSSLWCVHADPQKANTDAISASLATNKAEDKFADERATVRRLLGMKDGTNDTLVYGKDDWGKSHNVHAIFAKLLTLKDEEVITILTFTVAETLPCGSALVEGLGNLLSVNMGECWSPDDTFFDLLKDKEAINACLKEMGGKTTADAHIASTAKVQKKIISDYLDGTRSGGKATWRPRYMDFPMRGYTKCGGIDAINRYKAVRKHYKAA